MKKNVYDMIIVGGGTSGLFCAYEASKKGLKVALLEQRERFGEKLRLAGGGMGNMSNRSLNFHTISDVFDGVSANVSSTVSAHVYASTSCDDFGDVHFKAHNVSRQALPQQSLPRQTFKAENNPDTNYISHNQKEARFLLRSLFSDFSCDDVISLLESFKIPYEEREFGQIFCLKPVKYFVEAIVKTCKNVDFYTNTLVKHIHYTQEKENFVYYVRLENARVQKKNQSRDHEDKTNISSNSQELCSKKLVIATGSTAYPQIGASDFGLRLAKKWGHKVYDFYPVLVPLTLEAMDFSCHDAQAVDLSGLEGISVPVRMTLTYAKKTYSDPCDVRALLFTHRGVSGPASLVLSCFMALCDREDEQAKEEKKATVTIDFLPHINLLEIMHEPENGKKNLKNLLLPLLPDRLAYRLMPQDLQNKKVAELSKKQRLRIIHSVHKACFCVTKNEGLKKAEAASGGVSIKDINNSMESKLYKGLYFCGEVLDITGLLGGYNIHFALAAAKRIVKHC